MMRPLLVSQRKRALSKYGNINVPAQIIWGNSFRSPNMLAQRAYVFRFCVGPLTESSIRPWCLPRWLGGWDSSLSSEIAAAQRWIRTRKLYAVAGWAWVDMDCPPFAMCRKITMQRQNYDSVLVLGTYYRTGDNSNVRNLKTGNGIFIMAQSWQILKFKEQTNSSPYTDNTRKTGNESWQ